MAAFSISPEKHLPQVAQQRSDLICSAFFLRGLGFLSAVLVLTDCSVDFSAFTAFFIALAVKLNLFKPLKVFNFAIEMLGSSLSFSKRVL